MRAGFGLSIAASLAALIATNALAQSAGAPATTAQPQQQTPPPADTVGPRELRNFSLGGTAAPPAETTPAPSPSAPPASPATRTTPQGQGAAESRAPRSAPRPRQTAGSSASAQALPAAPAEPDLPPPAAQSAVPPSFQTDAPLEPLTSAPPIRSEREAMPLWPWLLAAIALAAGGTVFFRQRSRRLQTAGGPEYYEEPDAHPAPPPQPVARTVQPAPIPQQRSGPPTPSGGAIVSTRLRPWIDFEFLPTRCILDSTQATIEFVLNVTNSGTANARDLFVETMLFNAGPEQDQEIHAFFSQPVASGQPIATLGPLKSLEISNSVSIPVERIRLLDAGGRKLFVPLIGFTAVYSWSGGQGQSSRSFLLGREGKGEKLAPFHADVGPRVFRQLGAREHQLQVRR